jgi:RNA ligase (TIGR02306 family)
MRHLATLRNITDIQPHPNADLLELAFIDGWQVVVRKDEFQLGELVVYFEIDSVLPVTEEYEFLRKSSYVKRDWLVNGEGFRLKTIRLRKELSQGLITKLPWIMQDTAEVWRGGEVWNVEAGTDVTEFLGVQKWEPPVNSTLQGRVRGNFPDFIRKTDQERAQNLVGKIFGDWKDDFWEVSLKLDGSSMTVYSYQGRLGVCSRNLDLEMSEENAENIFIKTALDCGICTAITHTCSENERNLAVQGELMGPGIQGNREGFKELKFFIFDIFDIDTGEYLNYIDRSQMIIKMRSWCPESTFEMCPVIMVTHNKFENIKDMLEAADGPSINNPVREGLVWKSSTVPNRSFKTISNQYLLSGGE